MLISLGVIASAGVGEVLSDTGLGSNVQTRIAFAFLDIKRLKEKHVGSEKKYPVVADEGGMLELQHHAGRATEVLQ